MAGVLGLIGVVVGLMLGRAYEFWTTRRAELGAAIAAAAALEDELRRHAPLLDATWREHRSALTVFMWPDDMRVLAQHMRDVASGEVRPSLLADCMHQLYRVFWEEQQLFIFVAFVRAIPPASALPGVALPSRLHNRMSALKT